MKKVNYEVIGNTFIITVDGENMSIKNQPNLIDNLLDQEFGNDLYLESLETLIQKTLIYYSYEFESIEVEYKKGKVYAFLYEAYVEDVYSLMD